MYPFLSFGKGGENRTPINGFGDHCSTVKLLPYLAVGEGFEPSHRFTGLTR